MPLQDQASASLRLSFPFSVFQLKLACLSKAASLGHHPASAFFIAPAVFGATPLRRRLSSFAPATVDQIRSCVPGLFLGDVPLSDPHGFNLASRSRASVKEADRPTTLLGFSGPFAALFLPDQGSRGRPTGSNPACSLDERPPRRFFAGDRSPQSSSGLFFSRPIDQGTFVPASGIDFCPAGKRTR
jgi:hypothetical protein